MKKRVLALLLAFVALFQTIQPSFATVLEETLAEETVAEETVAEETQESISENHESSIGESLEQKIESENTATEEKADKAVVENVESGESTKAEAGEKTLTILHVNDTHGRYKYEEGSIIGYPKAKTIIDEFKKNGPTIALDAGDATHGTNFATLSQGESIVKLLDLTGFSAIVPGNHDFNYGKDRLLELSTKGSNLEFLSANIKVKEDGSNFLQSNKVFDVDGIKVGVFGLSTPETVYKSHPNNTKGLDFDQVLSSAQDSIKDLKAKGAEVIVLLSHLGTDLASEVNTFTLLDELSNKDDIDVIIDGHSHSLYPNGNEYKGSFIASAGQHFNNIGVTTITMKEDGSKIPASRMINVSDEEVVNAKENQEVFDLINQYESENEKVLSQVIGHTTTELDGLREHVRTRETNLADLITDAMRIATGADAALTNGGGIRASIDAGEITMGEALTVLPFGNLVTVIETTGKDIVDAINHGASKYPNPNGGFPQVSGIEYTIDTSSGEVKIVNVKIGGEPVDLAKTYKLATNDFMAVGGDGYTMFEGAYQNMLHGAMLDIFADYIGQLSANGPFTAQTDGRIKVNKVAKPETMEKVINNTPNRAIVTFKGDTQTQKAFNWYTTDKIEDSEVLVSKDKSMSNAITFKPEIEEVSSMYYERAKNGRFLYKALKDGEVIGYFTDENAGKISDLGTIAKDMGADTYAYPDRLYVTEHVYKALATGLEANTRYYYKIGSATKGYTEIGSFVTSGESGEKFEFLHYTDTQNYWQNENLFDEAWYGADTIRKALEIAPEASFVVHTGDIVETAAVEDEWLDLYEKSKDSFLNTTIAVNSGNHDEYGSSSLKYNPETKKYTKVYDEGDTTIYNRHVNVEAVNDAIDGGSYYSYDFNGMHFLSLNTNDYKLDGKALGPDQLAWIKKDVEQARANGAKWIVLNYHKPLFSKSYHSLQDDDVMAVKDEFMQLIDELDIDLALQGHDHVISRTKSLVYAPYEESPFFGKVADEATVVNGIDHYTNPKGTTFILPNTGGTKAYDDIYNKGIDHLRMVRPKVANYLDKEAKIRNKTPQALIDEYQNLFAFGGQPSQPEEFKTSHSNARDSVSQNFARYIVEDTKLTVMLYQIDGEKGKERTPHLVDSFIIENKEVVDNNKNVDNNGNNKTGGNDKTVGNNNGGNDNSYHKENSSTKVTVKPNKTKNPGTGDDGIILPVVLLAISFGALIIINKKKEEVK